MRGFTLALVMTLCSLTSFAQTTHTIITDGLSFSPNQLSIEVGDEVIWRNEGEGFHNVNGTTDTYPDNPEGFINGDASRDLWEFSHVFTIAGTYEYRCDPHAGANMDGVIVVNDNTSGGSGALVITEIMYNPPEGGRDYHEFVEIYNNSSDAVDMTGYSFAEGFEYTFADGFTLGANEFVLVALDSTVVATDFGVTTVQFTDGGLSNGGDYLVLVDAAGAVVDEVDFEDGGNGWPGSTDGGGASLVLCDVDADNNDASNWGAADIATGIIGGNREIYATPGALGGCPPDGPKVKFNRLGGGYSEGDETFYTSVILTDAVAGETYIMDVVQGSESTAVLGSDITIEPTTVTFTPTSTTDTVQLVMNIVDDAELEGIEYFYMEFANISDNLHVLGVGSRSRFVINDNDAVVADVVIYELMYSPPGNDGLYEFLELYNNDEEAVDLEGYYFNGINDTLPAVTLQPGEVFLIVSDSMAFRQQYGVAGVHQWIGGGLGNNGETIRLLDNLGNPVDEVAYDNGTPWPEGANNTGATLQLCDPSADNNDPVNWALGTNPTGIVINGTETLGTPGQVNNCDPVEPPAYTPYAIGVVTTVGANGVIDSMGVRAELTGVVHGVNLRPNGLQFTIIDANNDGIGTFNSSGDLGYTVAEGDEVILRGIVGQYNGLAQISLDEVVLNSSGNTLSNADVVTELNEDTESQLVTLEGVSIDSYVTAGGGLNVTLTDGVNEYLMRVDLDTELTEDFIAGFGNSPLTIIGIGGQFDSSDPYTEGYQILPRYESDITMIENIQEPLWAQDLVVFPNPSTGRFAVRTAATVEAVVVKNKLGQTVSVFGTDATIDISHLAAGLYFVEVYSAGERVIRRVVKQ